MLNEFISEGFLYVVKGGEDTGAVGVDGDCMLIMGRRLAVFGATLPAVFLDDNVTAAKIDHRFDTYTHAFFQDGSDSTTSVVGDFGVFVHFSSDAMSAHLADDCVAVAFAISLDCIRDVADALSS